MRCFKCANDCRTIYPKWASTRYIQSICPKCGWTSTPIRIPKMKRNKDDD